MLNFRLHLIIKPSKPREGARSFPKKGIVTTTRMRIGQALIESGLLRSEELTLALKEQEKTKERLGDIVLKKGFIIPEKMTPFLAEYFRLPYLNLKNIYKTIRPEVIAKVPEELAHRFAILPIDLQDNILTIAMHDPLDVVAEDTLRINTGLKIKRQVALEKDIMDGIDYCYHHLPRMQEHIDNFIQLDTPLKQEDDFKRLRLEASDPPVVKYVNSLVVQAINSEASDIHLQPKQDKVELKMRIDGVLYDIDPPPKRMLSAITTRIKILANMDIAERRLPQDGRFKMQVGMNEVDIRTSCFPVIYGESIVLRLLNTSSPLLGLEQLGFLKEDLEQFNYFIRRPYGLILVTGPTGSGKTTTLYTALNEIKSTDKHIITLEDPVEYRLPFIQQSQVNTEIGFDFARGLRSVLRQDPDVIMVGEIRDRETAEIAIHASMTGHLVFSTLHTNDTSGATVRLINMGVEPFLISSSLLMILAQRLVRKICPDCRREYRVNKNVLEQLKLDKTAFTFYKGEGCPKCLQSGYKGRVAIFEELVLDDKIRNLVIARASSEEIKREAKSRGMKTLYESGIEKMKAGITTPDEVLRVTQETEELGTNGI